jgi:hypothetical protein
MVYPRISGIDDKKKGVVNRNKKNKEAYFKI